MTPHHVSPIDENHLLYGNFIGLHYVFRGSLDIPHLKTSIAKLSGAFPAITGRYVAKSNLVKPSKNPVILRVQAGHGSLHHTQKHRNRAYFVQEPKRARVLKGRAPLATFTLTQFSEGHCVLGIAISHLLTDAAGYHQILHYLSKVYTALCDRKPVPDAAFFTHYKPFQFGTTREKRTVLNALEQRGIAKPVPIKGVLGAVVKPLIIRAMDKSLSHNPPVCLHFTKSQLQALKHSVLIESGEDWISTNTALCAHFFRIVAKLSYGDDLKTEMQIAYLLDLRGRYFHEVSPKDDKDQSRFVGNAILIHIDKGIFPKGLQTQSRGALARYFKARQTKTDTTDVKDRLDLLSDGLRLGYTHPELDFKNPILSLNNQSQMQVYNIQFGEHAPVQIVPQDVGDNIMIFPAANGGVEIYIRDIVNPNRQSQLLSAEWTKQIFDFDRDRLT